MTTDKTNDARGASRSDAGLGRIKALRHRHKWRGMAWDEWQKAGGQGTPDWICDKCGERRFWCDT